MMKAELEFEIFFLTTVSSVFVSFIQDKIDIWCSNVCYLICVDNEVLCDFAGKIINQWTGHRE